MEVIKRKNNIVYREKIYVDGHPITKSFSRKSDAKTWKNSLLADRNKGELNHKFFDKVRFQDFANIWLEEKIFTYAAKSTYKNYSAYLRLHFNPVLGTLDLGNITKGHIDRFVLALRKKGHNPKGINLLLGCLRNIFNEAVNREHLRSSPLKGFKNLKEDLNNEVYMTEMEIRDFLLSSSHDCLYPLYVTALNTGMRRGELAGLMWDRVNFLRSQIEVCRIRDKFGHRQTTKGGRRRIVPMNSQVKAHLGELFKNHTSDFVFTKRDGSPIEVQHIYRDFTKGLLKAQIDRKIRFHDLRHTFASHFMMNGGNLYDLQKILGHTQIEMTMRYAHLSPDHLASAINIVSFGNFHDVGAQGEIKVLKTFQNI